MDEIYQEVRDVLVQNDGAMEYKALYDAVDYRAKLQLYPALRWMKNEGEVSIVSKIEPGTHRAPTVITLLPPRSQ